MSSSAEQDPSFVFAEKFGFCGGVAAADQLMAEAAQVAGENGVPIFGFHEIVHNKDVVSAHEKQGVVFVDDLDDIDPSTVVVLSAHGVAPEVYFSLESKGCAVVDATCPLVKHTHDGAELARVNGEKVIYVCHRETDKPLHDEVLGTIGHLDWKQTRDADDVLSIDYQPVERILVELGQSPELQELLSADEKYRIITQTTLDADGCLAYRQQLKELILLHQPNASVNWASKGDVCRAVSDRQQSVAQLVELRPRRLVVVTDPGSKNGMGYARLGAELAEERGFSMEVVPVANATAASELSEVDGLTAVTASASTPDDTIRKVAEVIGAPPAPKSSDRVFHLRDAMPGELDRKIAKIVLNRA